MRPAEVGAIAARLREGREQSPESSVAVILTQGEAPGWRVHPVGGGHPFSIAVDQWGHAWGVPPLPAP